MTYRRAGALCTVGLVVLLGTVGCQYPISRQYRDVASKGVTVPMVQADPQAYTGDIVIWGGKILQTLNHPGRTEIVVLASPLDSGEEPLDIAHADGRFIGTANRFLDPEVYAHGRRVTLAGQITGTAKRTIGGAQYPVPVVEIKQIYVWTAYGYYNDRYYYPYTRYPWPYYAYRPWGGYYGGPYFFGGDGEGEEHEGGHEGGHERGR